MVRDIRHGVCAENRQVLKVAERIFVGDCSLGNLDRKEGVTIMVHRLSIMVRHISSTVVYETFAVDLHTTLPEVRTTEKVANKNSRYTHSQDYHLKENTL